MGQKYARRRLWVDPAFQSRLLARMALYLVLFAVAVFHIAFALELLTSVAADKVGLGFDALYLDYLRQQKSLLLTLVLVAPILLYDLLRFSHRIAGPLFRCRRVMQEMAEGRPVPEFTPRKGDLMRELFASFNALIRTCNARAAGTNGAGDRPRPEPAAFGPRES